MASKLRAPYHDSFQVLIALLLLLVPLLFSTSAQGGPSVLQARSEILQVLVPNRTFFNELVDCSNGPTAIRGFCIDVFEKALSILIPEPNWTDVNYTCYDVGPSVSYTSMINELQSNESSLPYDAVIGDITISAARMRNVGFTQPYLDSGIVLLTPAVGASQSFPGVFFAPFTLGAWIIVIGSVILKGIALLVTNIAEDENIPSEWLSFIFRISTIFFREPQKGPTEPQKGLVSKFVMVTGAVVFLLVGSGYTASFSSILTVNELSSDIKDIDQLKSMNLSIGFQSASIVEEYLKLRKNITNLVGLNSRDDFANALGTQKVAAIAEEIPYISLFLANQPASNCKFLVSPKLTTEGLGFAFHDESLSSAFSVAILNLSESGQLLRLQDGWKLTDFQCPSQIQSTQLDFKNSWGLFALLGAAMVICLLVVVLTWIIFRRWRNYERLGGNQHRDTSESF